MRQNAFQHWFRRMLKSSSSESPRRRPRGPFGCRLEFTHRESWGPEIRFSRGFSFLLYAFALLFAVACFYFSLSKAVFFWFHADELAASRMYDSGGLIGCVKQYYLKTTVNRLSADLSVCFMAKTASLWASPYLGWVFARLLFYTLIPISMTYLIRSFSRVSLRISLIIAFLLASFVYFILSDDIYYMFGLDLAIYATATWTFFMLLSLFSKSLKGGWAFIVFCIIFVLNLNSQEVFLVISAFFIPLMAYYRHGMSPSAAGAFIRSTLKDQQIWMLSLLYAVSALMTLLAPGLALRQGVWPSSGTWVDGLTYMLLSMEDTLYLMCKCPALLLTTFLMGVLIASLTRTQRYFNFKPLYVFLWLSPLMYLMLTGYLIGITPSLWIESIRPKSFQWITQVLNDASMVKHGALAIRQNLFLLTALYLDVFFAGFLLVKHFRKEPRDHALIAAFLLLLISMATFFYHPDRIASLRILSTFTKAPVYEIKFGASNGVSKAIFRRKHVVSHQDGLANLSLDAYLRANEDKEISSTVFDSVYQRVIPAYRVTKETPFIERIYAMYQLDIYTDRPCFPFLHPNQAQSTCSQVYGNETLSDRLKHTKIMPSHVIHLGETQGAELKEMGDDCIALVDTSVDGEHFAVSKLPLRQGLNYFVFETLPVKSNLELYIYLIGSKTSVLFPWLNMTRRSYHWSAFGSNDDFLAVFSERKRIKQKDILELVVDSPVEQEVQLRWQHGIAGNTLYRGEPTNVSQICRIEQGEILPDAGEGIKNLQQLIKTRQP